MIVYDMSASLTVKKYGNSLILSLGSIATDMGLSPGDTVEIRIKKKEEEE